MSRSAIFQSFWDGFLDLTIILSNGDEVSRSKTQHHAPGEDRRSRVRLKEFACSIPRSDNSFTSCQLLVKG